MGRPEKAEIPSKCPRRLEIRKDTMTLMVAEDKEYEVRDTKLPGFAVRVSPKGMRTFVFRWSQDSKDARAPIGRYPAYPVAAARNKAEGWFGMVAKGQDPRKEKAVQKAVRKAEAVTMGKVLDDYLETYVPTLKKNTQRDYKSVLRRLKERFGSVGAMDFNETHALQLHKDLAATPREANKQIAILSGVLTFAEREKLRAMHTNPCYLVERYPEGKRVRSLTPHEATKLGIILKAQQGRFPMAVTIVRLVLLTGGRPGEIEALEWSWVDLKAGVITVPRTHHKTGRKTDEPRFIGLGPVAISMLKPLHKERSSKWVFPNEDGTGPYGGLHTFWQRLRGQKKGLEGPLAKANMLDIHLYDLRHTFGTWARQKGANLEDLADMLGHTDIKMARRYAHALPAMLRSGAISVEKQLRGKVGK
jgi:integrase